MRSGPALAGPVAPEPGDRGRDREFVLLLADRAGLRTSTHVSRRQPAGGPGSGRGYQPGEDLKLAYPGGPAAAGGVELAIYRGRSARLQLLALAWSPATSGARAASSPIAVVATGRE